MPKKQPLSEVSQLSIETIRAEASVVPKNSLQSMVTLDGVKILKGIESQLLQLKSKRFGEVIENIRSLVTQLCSELEFQDFEGETAEMMRYIYHNFGEVVDTHLSRIAEQSNDIKKKSHDIRAALLKVFQGIVHFDTESHIRYLERQKQKQLQENEKPQRGEYAHASYLDVVNRLGDITGYDWAERINASMMGNRDDIISKLAFATQDGEFLLKLLKQDKSSAMKNVYLQYMALAKDAIEKVLDGYEDELHSLALLDDDQREKLEKDHERMGQRAFMHDVSRFYELCLCLESKCRGSIIEHMYASFREAVESYMLFYEHRRIYKSAQNNAHLQKAHVRKKVYKEAVNKQYIDHITQEYSQETFEQMSILVDFFNNCRHDNKVDVPEDIKNASLKSYQHIIQSVYTFIFTSNQIPCTESDLVEIIKKHGEFLQIMITCELDKIKRMFFEKSWNNLFVEQYGTEGVIREQEMHEFTKNNMDLIVKKSNEILCQEGGSEIAQRLNMFMNAEAKIRQVQNILSFGKDITNEQDFFAYDAQLHWQGYLETLYSERINNLLADVWLEPINISIGFGENYIIDIDIVPLHLTDLTRHGDEYEKQLSLQISVSDKKNADKQWKFDMTYYKFQGLQFDFCVLQNLATFLDLEGKNRVQMANFFDTLYGSIVEYIESQKFLEQINREREKQKAEQEKKEQEQKAIEEKKQQEELQKIQDEQELELIYEMLKEERNAPRSGFRFITQFCYAVSKELQCKMTKGVYITDRAEIEKYLQKNNIKSELVADDEVLYIEQIIKEEEEIVEDEGDEEDTCDLQKIKNVGRIIPVDYKNFLRNIESLPYVQQVIDPFESADVIRMKVKNAKLSPDKEAYLLRRLEMNTSGGSHQKISVIFKDGSIGVSILPSHAGVMITKNVMISVLNDFDIDTNHYRAIQNRHAAKKLKEMFG